MESTWDFVRTVLLDSELETHDVAEIFKGMVEQTDAFTFELVELTDEELRARVAELLGICYETQQPGLVGVVNWLFTNTMSFRDVDNYYIDFIFSNPLITEETLSYVIKCDSKISISEVLLSLLKNNVYGSRQYSFERIYPYVDEHTLTNSSLSTYIELAREAGDEEGLGFMKRVYVSRFSAGVERSYNLPRVSKKFYERVKTEECRALAVYNTLRSDFIRIRNVPIKELERGRQLEIRTLLERITGMKELDDGAFDRLISEGLIGLRQIKYIEIINWIETNKLFRKMYGPYNPDRVIRQSVLGKDVPEYPDFPEDPRKYFMHYYDRAFEDDWFTGICDHCVRLIPVRQRAFRSPVPEGGGWQGCFCSAKCSIKNLLSGPEYNVPIEDLDEIISYMGEQFKQFFSTEGFELYEGMGFLIREFPILMQSSDGEIEDKRSFRLPKIVVLPAREEKVKEKYSQDDQYEQIIQTGSDVLKELGLSADDFGLLKDEGETIVYHKEVLLKRDHMEQYLLTMLMNRVFGAEMLIIPPL